MKSTNQNKNTFDVKPIEKKATRVLDSYYGNRLPINVMKVAEQLGLTVMERDLGKNVSGVLVVKNGKGTIGYSKSENSSDERLRFTIAHEIGHYMLHRLNTNLFVDNTDFKVKFNRDINSTKGEVLQEREANAFAAALLMPEHLIQREIKNRTIDLWGNGDNEAEENIISYLAKRFKVSEQAMAYRLMNLRLY